MMWRPSYSPGFVLGKTQYLSGVSTFDMLPELRDQSPGKALRTALQEAREEFTLQSKGEGEVWENCKGYFTMGALPVTFTKVY